MDKQLYSALVFHQKVLSEKRFDKSSIVIGKSASADISVDLEAFSTPFTLYKDHELHLKPDMKATLSCGNTRVKVGEQRTPSSMKEGDEIYSFSENDWVILNLSPGLDLVVCFKPRKAVPLIGASPILSLSQALESPIARTLVISFALHSALLFFIGLKAEPIEEYKYLVGDERWLELTSNVDEHEDEDKQEEIPVIEDVDNVIIDDSIKDFDRPKIDNNPNPVVNLDNVKKPVGLQAALGGAKLHDMQSLFGSSAGLGNASDFMPETADGDAFGTGAGFGAGLAGIGFGGGGGGGGGGYGSGIGGMGTGGGGGGGGAKVTGPKKSGVKQKPKLTMDAPKQGAFCKESNIRDVVSKRANALRNCYEQQLLANPELSGKIIVFWKIGLDGKVTDASIKSSTMNNARVESCLTQTVRRLRFDQPDGGICVVEYPFIFASAQ